MQPTPGQPADLNYAATNTRTADSAALLQALEMGGCFLSVAAASSMLWAARLPVSNLALLAFGILFWMVSLVVAVAALHFRWTDPNRTSRQTSSYRRQVIRGSPVLLLVVTVVLLESQVPRRAMIALNRPAMNAWVKTVLAGPPPAPFTSARVGSFEARNVEMIPGGVRFLVAGCGFFRHGGGFAYSPSFPPTPCGAPQDTYTPIGGGWYIREYDGG